MVTRLASLFDHPSLYIHQFIVDSNLGDVCQQKKRHPSIAILPIMVSVDLLRQQRCLFTRNHTYSLSINLVLKDSEALLILTVNRGHRALRYVNAKMSVMDRMMLTRSFMLYASSDVLEFCHWSLKQSTNLSTLGFILSTQHLPVELSVTLGEISCTCM